MRVLNPEHSRLLMELSADVPYYKLIGMRVTDVRTDSATVVADAVRGMDNGSGILHGGVYASLLDCVCWWAIFGSLEADEGAVTLDLSVDYIKPARPGQGLIIAKGHLIRRGRTIAISDAECYSENDELLARARAKMYVSNRYSSSSQDIEALTGKPAPAKFIEV